MLRKTAEGQDEIATRARRLPPRQRSLLILIDGKRSEAELQGMVPGAEALLAELIEAGLVEHAGAPAVRAPAKEAPASRPTGDFSTPTAPAELVTRPLALSTSSLKARSMAASRWLNERLGPSGEAAAIRVEGAKNAEQLDQALKFAARIVEAQLGPAAAQTLIVHVESL